MMKVISASGLAAHGLDRLAAVEDQLRSSKPEDLMEGQYEDLLLHKILWKKLIAEWSELLEVEPHFA